MNSAWRSGLLAAVLAVLLVTRPWPVRAQAEPPQAVQAAVKDLAQMKKVPTDQVKLVRWQAVNWPDASLGFPQPGHAYAQVQVPGYRVILQIGGNQYEYHTDRLGRFVFCGCPGSKPLGSYPPVIEEARKKLAAKLGILPVEVKVIESPQVGWPTPGLGYPNRGLMYRSMLTPGYRLVLEAQGKRYEYHTDLGKQVKYGGEVATNSLGRGLLLAYLRPTSTYDGNNPWDMSVLNLTTGKKTSPMAHAMEFAYAPQANQFIFVRRDSRSAMSLWGSKGGQTVNLKQSFEFAGLSWEPNGKRYTAWCRDRFGGPWGMLVGESMKEPVECRVTEREAMGTVPVRPRWQGDRVAFALATPSGWRSFMIDCPGQKMTSLGDIQFADWLGVGDRFLLMDGDNLMTAEAKSPERRALLAVLHGLIWARVIPGGQSYVALTISGQGLVVWRGPLQRQAKPSLVTNLAGEFISAQLAPNGHEILILQPTPGSAKAQQSQHHCRGVLMDIDTARQDVIPDVCVQAQLIAAPAAK